MDVVVEVGGWEHDCCGSAIERNQVVDLRCIRSTGPDGQMRLVETHHDARPDERVQGRVTEVHVVQDAGTTQPVLRVPSGRALRGFDDDDGHLEDPWTGDVVKARTPAETSIMGLVPATRADTPRQAVPSP